MRHLRHAPGFTVTAVLILGVGIAAVVAMVSVYTRVVVHPVTVADPDALVSLYAVNPRVNFVPPTLSWPKYDALRRATTVFQPLAAYSTESINLSPPDGGAPEQLRALRVSAGFFETLALTAAAGRLFSPADDLPNGPAVCVLSHELWWSRFGGRDVVGTIIHLNDKETEVIGVLPPRLSPPWADRQILVPRVFEDSGLSPQAVNNGASFLHVVARLRPGAAGERVADELARVSAQYAGEHPGRSDATNQIAFRTLTETVSGSRRAALLMLLGAVVAVLLTACANVAAMFLSRLASRRREFEVRQALGASRAVIVRQLLGESLTLAMLAGIVGVVLAWLVVRAAGAALTAHLPAGVDLGLDAWALVGAVGAALVSGLMVGLLPALHVTGTAAVSSVGASDRGLTGGVAARAFRRGLVVVEVSLSVVLLVASSLLLTSFERLQQSSPGFDPAGVAAAFSNLTPARYPTPERRASFFLGVVEQLQQSPQVTSAAVVFGLPFHDENYAHTYAVHGRPVLPVADRARAGLRIVSEEYFAVMGIRVLEGRAFSAADRTGAPLVCILNASTARRVFGDQSAVGQTMLRGANADVAHEVIGVVADVHTNGLRTEVPDEIFYPFRQMPRANAAVVARTAGDPEALAPLFRQAAAAVDPAQPLSRFASMDRRLTETLSDERMTSTLTRVFAGVALLLALNGLVAVLAQAVVARRVEMGIRMAIGADRRAIAGLILRDGLLMVCAGIGGGIVTALLVADVVAPHLHGVGARDPWTFASVSVVFACAGAVASLVPALRAANVDPIVVLRGR